MGFDKVEAQFHYNNFSACVNETLENNKVALALFLDLSKAFDTIDHALLLQKLEKHGFRGPFSNIFTDYFTNRYQIVKIGNNSQKLRIESGVPQGSTLGQMLFSIYVNGLGLLPLRSKMFQ